jgi:transcriptional regulator with XRE-family HTH domain
VDKICYAESFKNLLCSERKRRKLTQAELSAKSGLTRQTIHLFESGKRVPTLLSIFHLSKGLNIPVAKFLSMLIKKIEFYEHKK